MAYDNKNKRVRFDDLEEEPKKKKKFNLFDFMYSRRKDNYPDEDRVFHERTLKYFFPFCWHNFSRIFNLNLLFIFRSTVQGMGHPLIPMCSGIAEMALRIPVIIFMVKSVGFDATAYAESIAWIGALVPNVVAYIVFICQAEDQSASTTSLTE